MPYQDPNCKPERQPLSPYDLVSASPRAICAHCGQTIELYAISVRNNIDCSVLHYGCWRAMKHRRV